MKRDPKSAMQQSEERIRERAYQLCKEEGRPPGREHAHLERARKLLEIDELGEQDNMAQARLQIHQSLIGIPALHQARGTAIYLRRFWIDTRYRRNPRRRSPCRLP